MRYGFIDEALTVVPGLLDAAALRQSRLPELFSGLSSTEVPFRVSYPSSCSPQAWAAAATLLCLRTLFRLDPGGSKRDRVDRPGTPREDPYSRSGGNPVGRGRLNIRITDGDATVDGVPADPVVRHAA